MHAALPPVRLHLGFLWCESSKKHTLGMAVHICVYTPVQKRWLRAKRLLLLFVASHWGILSPGLVLTEIWSQFGWWLSCFYCNNLKFFTVLHFLSYPSDLLYSVVEKAARKHTLVIERRGFMSWFLFLNVCTDLFLWCCQLASFPSSEECLDVWGCGGRNKIAVLSGVNLNFAQLCRLRSQERSGALKWN